MTCTAQDAAGNEGSATFTVTVADTIAPVITLNGSPPSVVVLNGIYTELGATATDIVDGTFAATVGGDVVDVTTVGIYIVTYDAVDAAGNAATPVTRTVIVQTASEYIQGLIDAVDALGGLPPRQKAGLLGPLDTAGMFLRDSNPHNDQASCGQLGSFIRRVERQEESGALTAEEAASFISQAESLKTSVGCRTV